MARYHLALGGHGYVIDPKSYRRAAARLFAPAQRQGQPAYEGLELGGAIAQRGFGDGLGLRDAATNSPGGYRWGAGVDIHSTGDGAARLGAAHAAAGTDPALVCGGAAALAVWRGSLWWLDDGASGDTLIYETDAAGATTLRHTWAGKAAGGGTLAAYRGALYAANAGDGEVLGSDDGTTWAVAFDLGACGGIAALAVAQLAATGDPPLLYAVAERMVDTDPGELARVYGWDGAALLNTGAPLASLGEPLCRVALGYAGALLLWGLATDGQQRGALYRYDGAKIERLADLADNGAVSGAVYRGELWLGMGRGEVWRWDGAQLRHAHTLSADGTTAYADDVRGLIALGEALWAPRYDGANGLGFERWDGAAWSLPIVGPVASSGTPAPSRQMAVYGGGLVAALRHVGGAGDALRLVQPADAFGLVATLETCVLDAGLPDTAKALGAVTLAHAALVGDESIAVSYRLEDAGAWTTLGASDAAGATTATFAFPAGTTARRFALRLTLFGGGAGGPVPGASTSTPTLGGVVVRYVVAEGATRRWSFDVLLEGSAALPQVTLDGAGDGRTGADKSAELWAAKAAAGPLALEDLDGSAASVWFVGYAERLGELSQRQGLQLRGAVELVEA